MHEQKQHLFASIDISEENAPFNNFVYNKATRSPEISHQQVQKLTPQFLFIYIYMYWT